MSTESGLDRLKRRLMQPPRLTAAADLPLDATEIGSDNFDLGYRLGLIYDILRHPRTRTPLSIAIYGDWGSGKTSAMKWLEARLRDWNAHQNENPDEKAVRLVPVRFYPWKYQEREDVWRGLVAEVILATLRRNDAIEKAEEQAKTLAFLGRGFVRLLSGVKLQVGAGETKATLDLEDVFKDEAEDARPETDYLKEFESALKGWLDTNLGDDERLIVFIDDLDRCMPAVALQVLEALKLYLNLDRLIFVVGVDRAVINELVTGHYRKLELSEDKSRDYLGKMFQVEVTVAPSELEADEFLENVLSENGTWTALAKDEQEVFRPIILDLARRSPREIKRLVNSALIAGEGIEMSSREWSDEDVPPTLAQGIQIELIRRILRERFTMETWVGREVTNAFFEVWSKIVCENPDQDPNIQISEEEIKKISSSYNFDTQSRRKNIELKGGELKNLSEQEIKRWQPIFLPNGNKFGPLLHLLREPDLGSIMRVPFSTGAARIEGREININSKNIINEAAAREINIKPEELMSDLMLAVLEIDISDTEIDDIKSLSNFRNIRELYMSRTNVSNINILEKIPNIEHLSLNQKNIDDISVLSKLKKLKYLGIDYTNIVDIKPIENLEGIVFLTARGTKLSDFSPISSLKNLTTLSLDACIIAGASFLKGLINMELLELIDVPITDISFVKNMKKMRELHLEGNSISEIDIIKNMNDLSLINIERTNVNDISVVKSMKNLRYINIGGTDVDKNQIIEINNYNKNLTIR